MVISGQGAAYSAGGVRSTNQRLISERGPLVSTSNATDLAVRGRGMLPVTSSYTLNGTQGDRQLLLTTTGSFRTDANGYLTSQSGLVLMGWPALADGSVPSYARDTPQSLEPIQIQLNQFSGEPTTKVDLGINLPASETATGGSGTAKSVTVEYFDNLGRSNNLALEFTPTVPAAGSSNEWTLTITDSAQGDALVGQYTLQFSDDRIDGGQLAAVSEISGGAYDPNTGAVIINVAGGPMEINLGKLGESGGITQLSDIFAPVSISKDGSPVGNMTSVEVDENGLVHAIYDTGVSRVIYQVPLVDVPNPNGLISMDYQTYMPSPASGSFFLWDAGDGPTGDIVAYALEESATDVAGELTDMIQTQRAYSSNAKVIQTVDEMLQETTNIKR